MASGANAYFQMPTSAINKILANNPKMFNTGLDNNGFNSLSKLNQLSKADALANVLAADNAAVVKSINATNKANNGLKQFKETLQSTKSTTNTVKNNLGNLYKGAVDQSKLATSPLISKAAAKGLGAAGLILAEAPTFSRYSATTPGMQQTMAENEAYLDAGYFRTDDGELIPLSNPTATPLPAEAGPAVLNAREKELFNGRTSPVTIHPDHPDYWFEKNNGTSTDIGSAPVTTPSTNIDALVKATIRGDYGNGADRKKALGANYDAVQKAINGMNLPKASGSKTSKVKEPSVAENLNKNSGNWMDTLNSLLPYLALGAGAYYLGRRS